MNPFYKVGSMTSFYNVASNPKKKVIVWHYIEQTTDESGIILPVYDNEEVFVTVQSLSNAELQQSQFINIAGIKYKFLFDSVIVSGLNKSNNKAQDYIQMNDIYYSIFLVEHENLSDDIVVWGSSQTSHPFKNNKYTLRNEFVSRDILD